MKDLDNKTIFFLDKKNNKEIRYKNKGFRSILALYNPSFLFLPSVLETYLEVQVLGHVAPVLGSSS